MEFLITYKELENHIGTIVTQILLSSFMDCIQCDQMARLFFNFWPFTSMKICPMAFKKCQSGLK